MSISVSEGFGYDFPVGQKYIPRNVQANCSIITIKVEPSLFKIQEDEFTSGKIKASFNDDKGQQFDYLSIKDRGFDDYAKKHQNNGEINKVLKSVQSEEEIYLRLGLTRRYQPPNDNRDGYWLQVNGIYTFPHFQQEIRAYG